MSCVWCRVDGVASGRWGLGGRDDVTVGDRWRVVMGAVKAPGSSSQTGAGGKDRRRGNPASSCWVRAQPAWRPTVTSRALRAPGAAAGTN